MKAMRITLIALCIGLAACGTSDNGAGPPPTDPTLPPVDEPVDKPPTKSDKIPDNAGEVFDVSADLSVLESFPIQVRVNVTGSLPTPCHELSWVENDDGSTIEITVFSIEPGPEVTCIAVIEPFELTIDLGTFENESRDVVVNGEKIGDFES